MASECLAGIVQIQTTSSEPQKGITTLAPSQGVGVTFNLKAVENGQATTSDEIVVQTEDEGNKFDSTFCNSDANQDKLQTFKPFFLATKHLPVTLLHKFDLSKIFKPVQEQVSKISDFFALAYHPNYGGINFLGPSQFWEMLKEKKQHLFSNAHVAVFGERDDLHDYPFAYRTNKT